MKKLLILVFIAGCFGCSKKSDPKPQGADTWITGKWKMTAAYNDTTANQQKVDVAVYLDVLTFDNNNNVTSFGAKTTFPYSLTSMTINESDVIFTIKQTSPTTLTLTHYGQAPFFEMFKKQ